MKIEKIARSLSLYASQAVLFSGHHTMAYLSQHVLAKNGMNFEAAGVLATARLQWLLEQTRLQLSGRFDKDEVTAMFNCFQGEIFFPDMFNGMATAICEDRGLELDEVADSSLAPLVAKLRNLSALERVTLADALEQAWYRAGEDGKDHFTILADLGIAVQ
ncbi:hypothetical protein [Cupriavidus pinatubonensis]|uniref:Uncharacterized protein n=1 Tax=Cupriavidus pinatubonensis TaxID=248026 RepID=A0ABN7YZR8_9BURK|nr:hypothetical protein [Cupriavidus pinatubonensis]CAG9179224.1 hypothetical protein LMG23994_04100 [Cupriavidus pinatubonensis]